MAVGRGYLFPLMLGGVMLLGGCVPRYAPRQVVIPRVCEEVERAAAAGEASGFDDGEARLLEYCQRQRTLRATEEVAALARLEGQMVRSRQIMAHVAGVLAGLALLLYQVQD